MLKKYNIIKEIGKGTFSTVYLGKNKLNNENVAIKIENIENEGSLRHEGKILLYLAELSCIPTVRLFGIENKKYRFLVMDYYEKSLQDLIKENTLNEEQKLFIFNTMINIIKYIHIKMVIHRDIKPANFMLSSGNASNDDLKIILIDFGLASIFNDINNTIKSRTIIGTPKYISTFVHKRYEPTPRDDFISVAYIGLFLYRNGTLPWDKCGNNHNEIYKEKCNILFKSGEEYIENFLHSYDKIREK